MLWGPENDAKCWQDALSRGVAAYLQMKAGALADETLHRALDETLPYILKFVLKTPSRKPTKELLPFKEVVVGLHKPAQLTEEDYNIFLSAGGGVCQSGHGRDAIVNAFSAIFKEVEGSARMRVSRSW